MRNTLKWLGCIGLVVMLITILKIARYIPSSDFSVIPPADSCDIRNLSNAKVENYFAGNNTLNNIVVMEIRARFFHDAEAASMFVVNGGTVRYTHLEVFYWEKKACKWGSVYCKNGEIDFTPQPCIHNKNTQGVTQ